MSFDDKGRMRRLSLHLLFLLASIVAIAAVACGDDESPGSGDQEPGTTVPTSQTATAEPSTSDTPAPSADMYGGVLNFGYFRAPTSPDGYQSSGGFENFFIWTNNEPIFAMDSGGGFDEEASLAESFEVLDEGLRVRFHLRDGVQFQGGLGEMTAEDVAWSLNRWHEAGALGCGGCGSAMSAVNRAEVVDEQTVDLILDQLDANIIVKLMGRESIIHSQQHWEDIGGQDNHKSNPIGTGAYKLVEWQPGTSIKYECHDDWWQGRPYADEVNIITIIETRTRLAALQTGQVNVAFLQSEMIPAARQDDKIDVWAGGYGIEGWRWNPSIAPLNDIRVRRALVKAIDREALNTSVYLDTMNINSSCTIAPGPLAADCADVWDSEWFGYDVEAARAMIEEYASETGQSLPLTLSGAVERRPDRQQLNEFLQGAWREIGVDYSFITTANVSASSDEFSKCETHIYSTGTGIIFQWQLEGDLHSKGSGSVGADCAAEGYPALTPEDQEIQDQLDELLDQAAATVDPSTREDLYRQADYLSGKHALWAVRPIMNRQNFFGCNNTITGGCGNEEEGISINRGEGFFRQSDFWVKK